MNFQVTVDKSGFYARIEVNGHTVAMLNTEDGGMAILERAVTPAVIEALCRGVIRLKEDAHATQGH